MILRFDRKINLFAPLKMIYCDDMNGVGITREMRGIENQEVRIRKIDYFNIHNQSCIALVLRFAPPYDAQLTGSGYSYDYRWMTYNSIPLPELLKKAGQTTLDQQLKYLQNLKIPVEF